MKSYQIFIVHIQLFTIAYANIEKIPPTKNQQF